MRFVSVVLLTVGLLTGAAIAADGDDEAAPAAPAAPIADAAPALLDDATFDAQFQCPETVDGADAREADYHRYLDWAREAHPDWTFRKQLDVRYGLLRRHACAQTLANIASAARAPFTR
jgi:hypothetical protein